MAILFESDISAQGTATWSPTRVQYVLFHTQLVGPVPTPIAMTDFDRLLRIGWFTFGTEVDVPSEGVITYWREAQWVNFLDTIWTAVPQTDSSANDFGTWATAFRWSLSAGVLAHVVVVGV